MPSRPLPAAANVASLLLSLAPIVAAQSSGGAQPGPFAGEITVTATGTETGADTVPAPVTVLTRQEMDDALEESVAGLLQRVPGITVMRSGDQGKVASLFSRGTDSDQTLVLFDGVRLNSPYYGGYDASLLATAGLERIEVARGPYSALWGADAVGGVVNLVPERGRRPLGATFFGEGGQSGWQRFEGTVGAGGEHLDLLLSGLDRSGTGDLDNSDFSTRQLLGDVGWTWDGGDRVGLVVQRLRASTGIPYVTPGEPTPNRRQWSDQDLVAVPVHLEPTDGWRLDLAVSQVDAEFRFHDPDDPWGLTEQSTHTRSREARLASRHDLGRHVLTWGGEWVDGSASDATNLGSDLNGRGTTLGGSFVQEEWHGRGGLSVLAGLRFDHTHAWGAQLSPRLHLGWALSETTELRASYGRAFRQPSLSELYAPVFGNPDLTPERSTSSEVGLTHTTASGRARVQVQAFATDLQDLIQFDFVTYRSRNVSSARIRGAELEAEQALTARLRQVAQVTFLDTHDGSGGGPLLRRPRWSGAYTLTGSVGAALRGDLTVLYVGARSDVDPVTFATRRVGGFVTADLAAAVPVSAGLELTVRFANLLNRVYEEVLGYPAPGRRVMAGCRLLLSGG